MIHYPKIEKKHLYQEVANNLEEMIMHESLKIGDKLPTETILAKRFGVSRNVLREGMKGLNERGLIELVPGKGAFIVKPTSKILTDMLNRLVVLGDFSAEHIYEIRLPLEVMGAGLAAERATSEQIEKVHNLVQQMPNAATNVEQWCDIDLKFHLTISEATGNPLFHSIISPLTGWLVKLYAEAYRKEGEVNFGLSTHQEIYEAIRSRNRKAAEKAMKEHILHSEKAVLGNIKNIK